MKWFINRVGYSETYGCAHDPLGRVTARDAETFGHNLRSELTAAALGTDSYAYIFDGIGNREQSAENAATNTYTANALNQYTAIISQSAQSVQSVDNNNPSQSAQSVDNFIPEFDADGNQTLIRTATGIWHVTYNAENRPVCFSNDNAVVDMNYDHMGRRFEYRETVNGTVTRHERHLYRGHLRIAALDMLDDAAVIHAIVWDPAEPAATRPLLLQTPSGWFTYGFDQMKNVTELFDSSGAVAAAYDHAPFGAPLSATGYAAALNPLRFSSEVWDGTLGLVYYNWRHLNVLDGRLTNRDPIGERGGLNLYGFVGNDPVDRWNYLGVYRGMDVIDKEMTELGVPVEALLSEHFRQLKEQLEDELKAMCPQKATKWKKSRNYIYNREMCCEPENGKASAESLAGSYILALQGAYN